jgi:hypothetical protein
VVAHTRLVAKAMEALHDLGDDGGLSLDPSADSFTLSAACSTASPMWASASAACGLGTGVLSSKALGDQQRYDISVQLGELQLALHAVNENLHRAAVANRASSLPSSGWRRSSTRRRTRSSSICGRRS